MMRCEFCGGNVIMQYAHTGVCQICGRTYSGDRLRRMRESNQPQQPVNRLRTEEIKPGGSKPTPGGAIALGAILICLFSGLSVGGSFFGAFGIPIVPIIIMVALMSGSNNKNKRQSNVKNNFYMNGQNNTQPYSRQRTMQPQPPMAQPYINERLNTAQDYLEAFRTLPLVSMPFREEAAEAMNQLSALMTKQQGIASLLPEGHPYYPTVNDAVDYFLKNIKQILFRLRYCDQNDMSRREEHRAFFRRILDENAAILRDFETFMIELSQVDDGVQGAVPCLDVLSQSMHSMREPVPDEDEFMRMLEENRNRTQMMQ